MISRIGPVLTPPIQRMTAAVRPRFSADAPPTVQLPVVVAAPTEKPGFVDRLKNSAQISWQNYKQLTFGGVVRDVAITTALSTALTFFLGPMHLIFIPTFIAVGVGWNLGWPVVSGLWSGLRGETPEAHAAKLRN